MSTVPVLCSQTLSRYANQTQGLSQAELSLMDPLSIYSASHWHAVNTRTGINGVAGNMPS